MAGEEKKKMEKLSVVKEMMKIWLGEGRAKGIGVK